MLKMIFTRIPSTPPLSIESFFSYINTEFFTPKIHDLENISISADSFKWIVLGLYFGLLIASLILFYNKQLLGKLPRALAAADSYLPENAKTLAELGLEKNIFIKISLLRGYTLRKVVRCVGEEEHLKVYETENADVKRPKPFRYKTDFSTDRFYIPEKYRYVAEIKFNKKGSGWLSLVLTAVLGLIAVILIIKYVPFIIKMFDNALGGFAKPEDNILQ